jgi:myo-inositol catabolism protein IolC
MKPQGYSKDLFILAYDHRGSFQSKLFGIHGDPTREQTEEIASYKKIIYDGFKKALELGVPKESAGILADEQFGSEILKDAKKNGIIFALPAEKSGQNEFDFQFGSEFGAHIKKFDPAFVKVLVRYNPEDDAEMNRRQAKRLRELSDYCHSNSQLYLFELLVPATEDQLIRVEGDTKRFDRELRAKLMVQAMEELVQAGVEPDIWKLEGVDSKEDAQMLADQAHKDGRENVGVVILGRGENDEKVSEWLTLAAQVKGYIGFAVGRTIFWNPLKAVKDGKISRDEATQQIAHNYKRFYEVWKNAKQA